MPVMHKEIVHQCSPSLLRTKSTKRFVGSSEFRGTGVSISKTNDDGTWEDYVPRGLELLWTGLERIWNFMCVVLRFLEDVGDICSSGDVPNWAALNSADAVEMRCFVDVRVSLLLVHPLFCLMHSSVCAGFHLQDVSPEMLWPSILFNVFRNWY